MGGRELGFLLRWWWWDTGSSFYLSETKREDCDTTHFSTFDAHNLPSSRRYSIFSSFSQALKQEKAAKEHWKAISHVLKRSRVEVERNGNLFWLSSLLAVACFVVFEWSHIFQVCFVSLLVLIHVINRRVGNSAIHRNSTRVDDDGSVSYPIAIRQKEKKFPHKNAVD